MREYTKPKEDAKRVLNKVSHFVNLSGFRDEPFHTEGNAMLRVAERQRRVGVIQLLNNRLGGEKARDYIYGGYADLYETEIDIYHGRVKAPANYPWWPDTTACDSVMPAIGAMPCPFCGCMAVMEPTTGPEHSRFAVRFYCSEGPHSPGAKENPLSNARCKPDLLLVAESLTKHSQSGTTAQP